jgi:uncharacterized membrane protein YfcA/ABC-type phosphate transport system substrate-binding protein
MYFPHESLWLILGGVVSGVLAGLLGIAGGIIWVPLLVTFSYTPLQAVATSSLANVIVSVFGSFQNWRMGSFDLKRVLYLSLPVLLTAQMGVYFAKIISPYLLLLLLGILLLINIYLLQLRKQLTRESSSDATADMHPILGKFILVRLFTGGAAGILAGLFGMGGDALGALIVPLQMFLLLEPIRIAIQTSLGVVVVTAVSACIGHAAAGNLLWIEGLWLGLGGLVGVQISTRLLPKLPETIVNLIFRIFLGLMSGYIFWQAWMMTTPMAFFLSLGMIAIALTIVWLVFTITIKSYKSFNLVERSLTVYSSVSKEWRSKLSLQGANPILLLLVLFPIVALFLGYRPEVRSGFQALSSNLSAMIQTHVQPSQASDCMAPAAIEKDRKAYMQVCTAMQDVLNVPAGQFFYGGTMGAAALRSQNFLDEIKRAHPEFQLRYLDPLSIPPDSSTGIKMLIDGELSFAESQRPLREAEYEKARNRGFTLKQIPVAITGVAFFTHPDLKIPGLSLEQIQGIYTGLFTNWKQLGGPDLPIIPISQDFDGTGSTISLLLQNLRPEAQHMGKTVQIVRDTTASLRSVGNTPGAIGYGTQALVISQRSIRLLGLAKGRSSNYVQPATTNGQVNKAALKDGSYPLIQRVFVIVRQDDTLDEVAGTAYANLLSSQKGQTLIDQAGYLPIRTASGQSLP